MGHPEAPPLFVHAWWRSASTYLWLKLRGQSAIRSYYEPLNDRIAFLTPATLGNAEPAVSLALRHPQVEANYFAEYERLLRAGTLHYHRELAYDRYLLRPDEPDEKLRAYLLRLIEGARSDGLRPALCFCRSQMRSAWMRANLGGLHVAQLRNPASQYASFGIERYFTLRMLAVAANLCKAFPEAFAHIPGMRVAMPSELRKTLPRDSLTAVFALLWIASTLQILDSADCVFDVDCVTADPLARARVTDWFAANGCVIDFSDCRLPGAAGSVSLPPAFAPAVAQAGRALRTHARHLAVFDASRVSRRAAELSGASAEAIGFALG